MVFIMADILAILGLVLTAVIDYYTLLVGRFIVGIAIGINTTIIPVYINEVSPV